MLQAFCRAAMAAVLLASTSLAPGPGSASAQWLVTPPLDRPPVPQRPPEWLLRREAPLPTPDGAPGSPQAGPGRDNGQAAPPAAGCPYQEKKLDLLV